MEADIKPEQEKHYVRLKAKTKAAKATGEKKYDEFMTDSEVDKAQKTKDVEHKTAKKQAQEQALLVVGLAIPAQGLQEAGARDAELGGVATVGAGARVGVVHGKERADGRR